MSELLTNVKQAGGITMTCDTSGTKYECTFLVPDSLLAGFLPKIGDTARWAPEKAYVTKYVKTFLATGVWSVRIVAEHMENESELSIRGIHRDG